MRRMLLAVLTLVAVVPWGGQAASSTVYPGAQVRVAGNLCTLNFIFKGDGRTYAGTAGHCGKLGEETSVGGHRLGTIRFQRDDASLDFALIEVDPGRVGDVSASVRGFGSISGATSAHETAFGDEVFVHGHGLIVGSTDHTRSRKGLLLQDTSEWYTANMPAVNGDSGGPVVHVETRKALGIVSTYGIGHGQPSTDRGPTVQHILTVVRAAGFSISLA